MGSNPILSVMFNKLLIDKKRRQLFLKFEKMQIVLKFIVYSEYFNLEDKIVASYLLQKLPRNSYATKIHNFCQLTGRSRGNFRYLGISRIQFRQLAVMGKIPGVFKSSW